MALSLLKNPTGHRLDKLSRQLTAMGGLAESQLAETIAAVENRDLGKARAVILRDRQIDSLQGEIEDLVNEILSGQRPNPELVRQSISAIKIASGLERIGDLARNVCKRLEIISASDAPGVVASVGRMGRVSLKQLSDALNALTNSSADAAMAVWGGDDQLDELYNSIFSEILSVMSRDPTQVSACTHLVFAAKNFERVGDHATNIAENVYFRVTGSRLEDNRPKQDITSFISVDEVEQ